MGGEEGFPVIFFFRDLSLKYARALHVRCERRCRRHVFTLLERKRGFCVVKRGFCVVKRGVCVVKSGYCVVERGLCDVERGLCEVTCV